MSYIIVGLGNPGEEYANTRHNVGRMVVDAMIAEYAGELKPDKKTSSLKSDGKIGKDKVVFLEPETFMNNSGKALLSLVKSKKAAAKLVVVYDDFNLPLGRMKISWNRSSGGHNGLESIIKAVKTEEFLRFRIGTAPATTKGTARVPHGEDKIEKFILGKFKDDEIRELKKVAKNAVLAIEVAVKEGREKAMSLYNR